MRERFAFIQGILIRSRWVWISCLNVLLTIVSFSGAALALSALRPGSDYGLSGQLWIAAVVLCGSRLAAYGYFHLNRGYWKYVSATEALEVVVAHLCSSMLFITALAVVRSDFALPWLAVLEFTFSVLLALGARLAVRLFNERYLLSHYPIRAEALEVVVIGAGADGHFVVKTLLADRGKQYKVSAVFDDNPARQGMLVHGCQVIAPVQHLTRYLEQHPRVSAIIEADPSLSTISRRYLSRVSDEFRIPLRAKESAEELVLDSGMKMSVNQILNRKPAVGDRSEVTAAISGKRVLITGAGGSIGSELVRQVQQHNPAKLILVDKSEFNLYAIGQELSAGGAEKDCEISYHLTDVVDHRRLSKLFLDHGPQLVFHAAAYKHVPLLENNGYEGFVNNVLGTLHVLEASKAERVERFVLVSTDKAVAPSSAMGCTKRICEFMVQQVNDETSADVFPRGQDHQLKTAVVRFGNVINSAGSVIPLFKRQILNGEPITVTDEQVERYFMSIEEAATLILTAGTLGENGEIFMLDMGEPIKITEVAKKLRAVYGRRDVPIEIVGLRPGEKLTEELYYSKAETRTKTRFEKVFAVRSPKPRFAASVFSWVKEIAPSLNHLTDDQIPDLLRAYTREIQAVHDAEAQKIEPRRTSSYERSGSVLPA